MAPGTGSIPQGWRPPGGRWTYSCRSEGTWRRTIRFARGWSTCRWCAWRRWRCSTKLPPGSSWGTWVAWRIAYLRLSRRTGPWAPWWSRRWPRPAWWVPCLRRSCPCSWAAWAGLPWFLLLSHSGYPRFIVSFWCSTCWWSRTAWFLPCMTGLACWQCDRHSSFSEGRCAILPCGWGCWWWGWSSARCLPTCCTGATHTLWCSRIACLLASPSIPWLPRWPTISCCCSSFGRSSILCGSSERTSGCHGLTRYCSPAR